MNDLKPCPFCGGNAELWRALEGRPAWVACLGKCAVLVTRDHMTDEDAIAAWNRRALPAASQSEAEPVAFQQRVRPWMLTCFGAEISGDRLERGDRLLEEVFELLQSGDYPKDRVAALMGYVWSRPAGEPAQEVGGVMVTLAAYCLAHGLDMHEAAETELARIWTKVDKIRAKQKAKPTGSALPQEWATPAPVVPAEGAVMNCGICENNATDCECTHHEQAAYEKGRSDAQAEIAALRAQQPAAPVSGVTVRESGWQPISTAPKDGTFVDLWCLNLLHHAKKGFRKTNVSWGTVTDWYGSAREDWRHGHGEDIQPTHWMPIPEPPVLSALEDK